LVHCHVRPPKRQQVIPRFYLSANVAYHDISFTALQKVDLTFDKFVARGFRFGRRRREKILSAVLPGHDANARATSSTSEWAKKESRKRQARK
jgi:hypothetical protein